MPYQKKEGFLNESSIEAVELVHVSLQSEDVPVDIVQSSEVFCISVGDTTELAAELDNAKARIAKLGSVDTITVRPDEELLNEIKRLHAKKIGV